MIYTYRVMLQNAPEGGYTSMEPSLPGFTVVQPDLCVICDPTKLDEKGCNGAPDLIVEILSPFTSTKDINDKYEIYEEAGVREYWIVSPLDKVVDVFVLNNGKYRLIKKYSSDQVIHVNVLSSLSISLKDIFE